jgi:hypothetical protein
VSLKPLDTIRIISRSENLVSKNLSVSEELWKDNGLAEDVTFQCSRSEDRKSYIKIYSWNISKGLVLKLEDENFLQIVRDYDVLFIQFLII